MHLLLTGGTGYIGRALAQEVERVTILTRNPDRARTRIPKARCFAWDPYREPPPAAAFEGVDGVVNLIGDSIGDGRWTEEKKASLRASRLETTRRLVDALENLAERPRVLVSSSALGYYGDRGEEVLTETSGPGDGFLAELAQAWEAEAERARSFGTRVVTLRTALVLGRGGETVERLFGLFRRGLGGRLGNGQQWMSWIHIQDLVQLYLFATQNPELAGAMNGGSPEPLRNRDFTRLLADALHRPAVLPAPAFALRLVLGEFAKALLSSQRMQPAAALTAGFRFRYSSLASALTEITGEGPKSA